MNKPIRLIQKAFLLVKHVQESLWRFNVDICEDGFVKPLFRHIMKLYQIVSGRLMINIRFIKA